MSSAEMTCLYIGLGVMGYHMAGHLSKSYRTYVVNRTYNKAVLHAEEFGSIAVKDARQVLGEVDFIFTCLPTSREVREYAEMLVEIGKGKEGAVWVDNTSGEPDASKEIAKRLAEIGVEFVDAPISGGRKGAMNATLTIMVSGPVSIYERILPVLSTMGKNISHLGDSVGQAHAVKGLNNLLFASNLVMGMKVAQALEKHNLNPDKALSAMLSSSGGSNALQRVHEYVTHNRTIDYSFIARGLVKDMNIGLSLLSNRFESDPSYTMLSSIRDLYEQMVASKGSSSDVFDIFEYIE